MCKAVELKRVLVTCLVRRKSVSVCQWWILYRLLEQNFNVRVIVFLCHVRDLAVRHYWHPWHPTVNTALLLDSFAVKFDFTWVDFPKIVTILGKTLFKGKWLTFDRVIYLTKLVREEPILPNVNLMIRCIRSSLTTLLYEKLWHRTSL